MSGSVVNNTLIVAGREFDRVDDDSDSLLRDIFPDTSTSLLPKFEAAYSLPSDGTTTVRRVRIITAMRARGGISRQYIEQISNNSTSSLGPFDYTFDAELVAPPDDQSIRYNNASFPAITEVYIDKTTRSLSQEIIDKEQALTSRVAGDFIYIFDRTNADDFNRFTITAVTDMGDYVKYGVTGNLSNFPFVNDGKISLVLAAPDSVVVKIKEGTGTTGFVIHTFGPSSIPLGPATPMPGVLRSAINVGDPFTFEVFIYQWLLNPMPNLEALINRLKMPQTIPIFIYVV